nr:MAG: hypothetical protein E3J87_02925 [Candidatus Cloacimonadota bacterium]
MIIKGYFHRDKTPFVDVLLEIPLYNIKRKVPFLIDTGSPITILSERDARKLKINYNRLKSGNGNIMGLGGFAETYILKKVILHFFTKAKMTDVSLKELLIYRNVNKDENIINQIPSLLGRDVLREFTLIFDEKNNIISLKK